MTTAKKRKAKKAASVKLVQPKPKPPPPIVEKSSFKQGRELLLFATAVIVGLCLIGVFKYFGASE